MPDETFPPSAYGGLPPVYVASQWTSYAEWYGLVINQLRTWSESGAGQDYRALEAELTHARQLLQLCRQGRADDIIAFMEVNQTTLEIIEAMQQQMAQPLPPLTPPTFNATPLTPPM
jgi:hypothetical protein